MRFLAVLLLISPLLAAEAPASASRERLFVYVSVGRDSKIAVFRLDPESGALDPAGDVPAGGRVGCLAVDPQRKYLYAAIRSTRSVSTFRIDPRTGGLSLQGTVPVVDNAVYIVTDRSGKFLLTSYYGAGKAAVYPIGDDGKVGEKATEVRTAEKNPHSILMDPTNRFVYVPNTGADSILQYRFDAERGTLAPLSPPRVATAKGAGPRHVSFHPSGKFIYFVNEKNSSVTAYRRDVSSGTVEAIQTLPTLPEGFSGRNTCADVEVTPSGRFLYASNRGHDSIAGFSIDGSTGRLTSVGQFRTEKTPRSFNVDPTERFLIVAGQGSGRLAAYRLDGKSGRLSHLKTLDVGRSPSWVQIVRFPE